MFSSLLGVAKEYLCGSGGARTAARSMGCHAWSLAQPSNGSQRSLSFIVPVTKRINLWEVPLHQKQMEKEEEATVSSKQLLPLKMLA